MLFPGSGFGFPGVSEKSNKDGNVELAPDCGGAGVVFSKIPPNKESLVLVPLGLLLLPICGRLNVSSKGEGELPWPPFPHTSLLLTAPVVHKIKIKHVAALFILIAGCDQVIPRRLGSVWFTATQGLFSCLLIRVWGFLLVVNCVVVR